MLEKHLGHLKKHPTSLDHMGAPPPPSLAQVAAKNSLKTEDSPATSPATVSNWNSPGNTLGVSPAASNVTADEYMTAISAQQGAGHAAGPFQLPPGMPPPVAYGTSPLARPLSGPQLPQAHRRHISEISGGAVELGPDIKRQQLFQHGPSAVVIQPHLAPAPHQMHPPMGQAIQAPMNPIQRRSG